MVTEEERLLDRSFKSTYFLMGSRMLSGSYGELEFDN